MKVNNNRQYPQASTPTGAHGDPVPVAGATLNVASAGPAHPLVRPKFGKFLKIKVSSPLQTAADGTRIDIEKLEKLVGNNVYFHGSRSSSLLIFTDFGMPFQHALMPMGMMLAQKIYPYSGEAGNSLASNALNRMHISVVDTKNFLGAYNYATRSFGPAWEYQHIEEENTNHVAFNDGIDPDFEKNNRELRDGRNNQWHRLDSIKKEIVRTNFPVIYALDPGEREAKKVSSDIAGEHAIKGSVEPASIKFLFVPSARLNYAKNIFSSSHKFKGIEVRSFSDFTADSGIDP